MTQHALECRSTPRFISWRAPPLHLCMPGTAEFVPTGNALFPFFWNIRLRQIKAERDEPTQNEDQKIPEVQACAFAGGGPWRTAQRGRRRTARFDPIDAAHGASATPNRGPEVEGCGAARGAAFVLFQHGKPISAARCPSISRVG